MQDQGMKYDDDDDFSLDVWKYYSAQLVGGHKTYTIDIVGTSNLHTLCGCNIKVNIMQLI